jgi:hypothetical protein
MADQPAQPDRGNWELVTEGAIPRMGLNIPVPPVTMPPPAAVSTMSGRTGGRRSQHIQIQDR